MSDYIHSYSVPPKDTHAIQLIQELKSYSLKTGINMSRIVLEGLKYYKAIKIDNSKKLINNETK